MDYQFHHQNLENKLKHFFFTCSVSINCKMFQLTQWNKNAPFVRLMKENDFSFSQDKSWWTATTNVCQNEKKPWRKTETVIERIEFSPWCINACIGYSMLSSLVCTFNIIQLFDKTSSIKGWIGDNRSFTKRDKEREKPIPLSTHWIACNGNCNQLHCIQLNQANENWVGKRCRIM